MTVITYDPVETLDQAKRIASEVGATHFKEINGWITGFYKDEMEIAVAYRALGLMDTYVDDPRNIGGDTEKFFKGCREL